MFKVEYIIWRYWKLKLWIVLKVYLNFYYLSILESIEEVVYGFEIVLYVFMENSYGELFKFYVKILYCYLLDLFVYVW